MTQSFANDEHEQAAYAGTVPDQPADPPPLFGSYKDYLAKRGYRRRLCTAHDGTPLYLRKPGC